MNSLGEGIENTIDQINKIIDSYCYDMRLNETEKAVEVLSHPQRIHRSKKNNIVSITLSRSLYSPLNANILPAFNFIMSGSRYSFFNNY